MNNFISVKSQPGFIELTSNRSYNSQFLNEYNKNSYQDWSQLTLTISKNVVKIQCPKVYNDKNKFDGIRQDLTAMCDLNIMTYVPTEFMHVYLKLDTTEGQCLNILQIIHNSVPLNKSNCIAIANATQIPINEILDVLELQSNEASDLKVLLQLQAEVTTLKAEMATLKAEVTALKGKNAELTAENNNKEEKALPAKSASASFF